jgi:rubrerythrin
MVTLVGTQADFIDAIKELIELEYDAVKAYELAVEKLETASYKTKMLEFLNDHRRHIDKLTSYLSVRGIEAPTSGDLLKGMLAKLKVVIGNLTTVDENILRAMLDNEKDTNKAYENMINHESRAIEIESFLIEGLNDERRHKAWLENVLEYGGGI